MLRAAASRNSYPRRFEGVADKEVLVLLREFAHEEFPRMKQLMRLQTLIAIASL
jgi:hypothetical protein